MDITEMDVTKEDQFATYRQTITPNAVHSAEEIISALFAVYKGGHITGPIMIHFNQGGVRNIVADQTVKVPNNSDADYELELLFGRISPKPLTEN